MDVQIIQKFLAQKHALYRGKDCMKKFDTTLREHAEKFFILKIKKCYR